MFVLTGVSHFVGMRADLISMVPPALPEPALLVTLTGILDWPAPLGCSGQDGPAGRRRALHPARRHVPGDVYAATEGLIVGGSPADRARTLMHVT